MFDSISYGEIAACYEYAEEVIAYSAENGLDITGPAGAKYAILQYDNDCSSFESEYEYPITDYLETIIDVMGLLLEEYSI